MIAPSAGLCIHGTPCCEKCDSRWNAIFGKARTISREFWVATDKAPIRIYDATPCRIPGFEEWEFFCHRHLGESQLFVYEKTTGYRFLATGAESPGDAIRLAADIFNGCGLDIVRRTIADLPILKIPGRKP